MDFLDDIIKTPKKVTNEYRESVVTFVKDTLDKYVLLYFTDPKIRNLFRDKIEDNVDLFILAFTHKTYDRVNNYEVLEKTGDSYLHAAAITYLVNLNDSKLTPEVINNYIGKYLAKDVFSRVSEKLGINRYLRHVEDAVITSTLLEDCFESFCGALYKLGQKVSNGGGYVLCSFMVKSLAEKILNWKYTREEIEKSSSPDQWIKQIFDILAPNQNEEQEQYFKNSEGKKCFRLKGKLLDLINQYNQSISNHTGKVIPIIEEQTIGGEGDSPESFANKNFKPAFEAREWLKANGVNDEFIHMLRMNKYLKTYGLSTAEITKLIKAMEQGPYISIDFNIDETISDKSVSGKETRFHLSLVGIKFRSDNFQEDILVERMCFGEQKTQKKEFEIEFIKEFIKNIQL